MKKNSVYMAKDKNIAFGIRLKSTIREQGMRQGEFAKKVGINPVTLSRYVCGVNRPKPDFLKRVADALGVTVNYLYGREDDVDL